MNPARTMPQNRKSVRRLTQWRYRRSAKGKAAQALAQRLYRARGKAAKAELMVLLGT